MSCKVGMISLGCAKNMINSEQMLYRLRAAGYDVSGDVYSADVVVINTCGFIESAKEEAIENILECAELKKQGKIKKIVVAGCLPQRYRDEILAELPEADALVGCGSFDEIERAVSGALAGERPCLFSSIDAPVEETERIVTSGPGWAYIKIAEGCDNRCAYCVIPSIRGRFRSRPMENVVAEAKRLAAAGCRELIVVAQDTTRYGEDIYGRRSLPELLKKLCAVDGIEWIRVHYMYPDELDDAVIDAVASERKILRYFDIPMQHINDGILRRMNRRGTGGDIRALVKKLRERLPGVVLRTSIIAGLPGEGEAEFEELCGFLREAKIERAGVFAYSPEEGTPAAEMERPDSETAAHRAELLADIQADIMDEFNYGRIGTLPEVICMGWDEEEECFWGRSYAESPDVDGRILFTAKRDVEPGEIVMVRITGADGGDVFGEVEE